MGGQQSRLLDSKQRKNLAGRSRAVVKNFAPHYRRQYATAYVKHIVTELEQREGAVTQLQRRPVDLLRGEKLLEGTLLQFQDQRWSERRLLVTGDFLVESSDIKEDPPNVQKNKTRLLLSGCDICTSTQEYRLLWDRAIQEMPGTADFEMPNSPGPFDYPVFIHHPYRPVICICAHSEDEQLAWLSVLRNAIRHHSTVILRQNSFQGRAFLEAVRHYRQEKGRYDSGVLMLGSEEDVLSMVVMEDVLPGLRSQVFPRLRVARNRRGAVWGLVRAWMVVLWVRVWPARESNAHPCLCPQLLTEVFSLVCGEVSQELHTLKEHEAQGHPLLDKQVRLNLDQILTVQEHITRKMRGQMASVITMCVARLILPSLGSICQELAGALHSAFSAAREVFTDACDAIMSTRCCGRSVQELTEPLAGLPHDSPPSGHCYRQLELIPDRLAGLQDRFGFQGAKGIVLRAQNALEQFLEDAVYTFECLLSQQLRHSMKSTQISLTLRRVYGRVLKLDHDSVLVQTDLLREALVEITLPWLLRELEPTCKLELPQYEEMVFAEHSAVIHIENIYEEVVLESLLKDINSVLRDAPSQYQLSLHCSSLMCILNSLGADRLTGQQTPSSGSYENVPFTVEVAAESKQDEGHDDDDDEEEESEYVNIAAMPAGSDDLTRRSHQPGHNMHQWAMMRESDA
ncbi:protein Niban 1-like isoform X2 [Polypterus senegalus]|uniref:protein Niban 1-like isoform X2 n=1 Tax=Polypterus senegalus TaxID=55291 RepID=UPI0019622FDB|nr:protein Niban 1-like isoform X2 [Polypterus senegalus]